MIDGSGALFFEQRNGVLLPGVGRSYFVSGLTMTIRYPCLVSYEDMCQLLEES